MRKKLVIELIIYIIIVIIGVIMLFMYEPEDVDILLPKDFHIEQEGGVNDAFVPIE